MEYLKTNKKVFIAIAVFVIVVIANIIFFYPKINKVTVNDDVSNAIAIKYEQELNQARIKYTEDSIVYADRHVKDSLLFETNMKEIAKLKEQIKNLKYIYEKQKAIIELDDVDADVTDLRRRLPKKGN